MTQKSILNSTKTSSTIRFKHVEEKFPEELVKPSCEEGRSLSSKVSYSVILELNRTYA